jgi:CRP-like cAMP-binding protein
MSDNGAPDPIAAVARIAAGKSELTYPKDQVLFTQGDPAEGVFLLQKGNAKVTVVSTEGREAVVGILRRGDFCGEECLDGHALRMATVTALTECVVTRIDNAAMLRAVREDISIAAALIAFLAARNIRTQDDLADLLLNSTEKRLARLLLILANGGEDNELKPIVPKVSQEMLAEMIGTSRTHVNFFMNKFRRLGLLDYNSEIKIDRPALRRHLRSES